MDVPAAFAGVPDVRIVYRTVRGRTVEELARGLEASADHPLPGASSYAHTESAFDWNWQSGGRPCRVVTADVTVRFTVTLPRAFDEAALDPDVAGRWRAFRSALETHEAGHVRLALARLPSVRRAVLAAPCDDASDAGHRATAAIDREQADYDRRTRYGALQGARFP
jgi:predicted secreted Zn-dependent protease